MARAWKKSGKRLPLGMVAVLICLGFTLPALAAEPQDHIKQTLDAVTAVLDDPQLQGSGNVADRKQRVRKIIYETFDFQQMAKEALGPQWDKLTPQQREEFVGLFGDLFERSYNLLVLRFLGARKTIYGKESVQQNRATVHTTLVSKSDEKLPTDYQLINKGQRWAVFDVVVDGVSLATTYRAQFGKIIRESSYEALLQKIKTKLERESF